MIWVRTQPIVAPIMYMFSRFEHSASVETYDLDVVSCTHRFDVSRLIL